MSSSLLPSIILVNKKQDNFDPFHDFFPEALKGLDQYWNFGELLKEVFYFLEDEGEESLLDKFLELRLLWNTLSSNDTELEDFFRNLVFELPELHSKYRDQSGGVYLGKLSESNRVREHLRSLDTDGFSRLIYLVSGRLPSKYEDLQLVLALQRLKGSVWSLGALSSFTDFRFAAFYRRYPTGRKVKVKRYYFGRPRYGDPGIYNGIWVYGNNVFFREEEVDEYYVGPGWEDYFGIIGRPVRYTGEEVYDDSGNLVYGEVRFFPDPCEVWVVSDLTHLEVSEGSNALENLLEGSKRLLSPCAEVYLFPFLRGEERTSVSNSVVLEEVQYFVGVLGPEGVVSKRPDEISPTDVIVDYRLGEYIRIVEEVS